jgi:copper chaperone CopZ
MEIAMKTALFRIEGMNCDACAKTIKNIVQKEPGVRMASVSFGERQARVLYDPQTVLEDRLVEAIQKPGFRVTGRETINGSDR